MNPIKYWQNDGYRLTSNPHEYYESYNPNRGKKPFGKRDLFSYGKPVDSYCNGYHRAVDMAKTHNAPIKSFANAQVLNGTGWNTFGWTLVLGFYDAKGKHYQVILGHLNRNPLLDFKIGDAVKKGQVVAYQGTSNNLGVSMASHLHAQFQPFGALGEWAFTCNGVDPWKIDVSNTHATRAPGDSKSASKPKTSSKVDKTTHLVIAGHGPQRNGSYDPGATGFITQGEHRYVKDTLFPAMRKHIPKGANIVLYSAKKVSNHGNLRQLVKQYNAKQVTEIHFDAAGAASARRGHVIIHNALKPDKYDFALRDAINAMVGTRYTFRGHNGLSGRGNLYNVNDAYQAGIAYRLIELGFGTNKTDADIMTKQADEYAKQIVNALVGNASGGGKAVENTAPAPKANTGSSSGWKTNIHGTRYKPEKATFTVGNTRIMSREASPFTSAPQGGWCYPRWWIRYDELCEQNGFLWIGYNQNGKRWYLPIRECYGPGNYGPMWGTARLGW